MRSDKKVNTCSKVSGSSKCISKSQHSSQHVKGYVPSGPVTDSNPPNKGTSVK